MTGGWGATEDTSTFVRVGAVRTALLSAVPLLADAFIAGENRSYVEPPIMQENACGP